MTSSIAFISLLTSKSEAVVAEAQNVLMLTPFSNHKQGISGSLSVTNFKLSFITTDVNKKYDYGYQQNILLGEHEVSLSNIDVVYQILRAKKRRLSPGIQLSGKVKGLQIICKNMKVLTFMFKFSPIGHGKNVTQAILHHAFPRRHQLLFAYDYQEVSYFCPHNVCLFQDQHDWLAELQRTKCRGWRISSVNCNFRMSPYLPQHLVIPLEVSDQTYMNASKHFQGNFPPVWCWGTTTGAALLRMADIDPSITERDQENIMLEKVRRSHPKQQQPYVIDLHVLPSPKDVQNSFTKFRELCTPETIEQFWIQDNHFFSLLDASKWLHTVSGCLQKSVEAAVAIEEGLTVVLQGKALIPLRHYNVSLAMIPLYIEPMATREILFTTCNRKPYLVTIPGISIVYVDGKYLKQIFEKLQKVPISRPSRIEPKEHRCDVLIIPWCYYCGFQAEHFSGQ
ncbi:hypothetical protein J437_LFUL001805 [Ladona fulva]|uniref:Myotubularin phosphatase domain-containing protein n=1 Tax=Ladona fulva TaxID=123851 RepID=A0A8K0JXG6_LADFU|nr:hypothetical protein J437_LFUL001805 [Ladona fulva]